MLVSESDDDHLLDHGLLDVEGSLEVSFIIMGSNNRNWTILMFSQLGPGLSEETLLHDDEEDDEDNEGRSWRR